MKRLRISPIPIGHTLGHLLKAFKRQLLYSNRFFVVIFSLAILLVIVAKVFLKFLQCFRMLKMNVSIEQHPSLIALVLLWFSGRLFR